MTPEEQARKARGKEIHRRVMIALGALIAASALAAWHIGRGGAGFLQTFMFGRLGRRQAPAIPAVRSPATSLVAWREFGPEALRRAREEKKLVFLSVAAPWSAPSRWMDEGAYASPDVAKFLSEETVAVRVDAEARPDLALRYVGPGWPATALLLPSGEVVEAGTYMDAPLLLSWAKAVTAAYAKNRERIAAALTKDAPEEHPTPGTSAREELEAARGKLEAWWALSRLRPGFGLRRSPPADVAPFPHFDWLDELLSGVSDPWAVETSTRAAPRALRLEDPVWGGFYRDSRFWRVEREKLLEDQASAVAALARLSRVAEARRTLDYAQRFLRDRRGGWASSQAGEADLKDGSVESGDSYFAKSDTARLAAGMPRVDRRLFASENAAMARAILWAGTVARPRDRAFALKTLERWWTEGVRDGRARRELGRKAPSGLLDDQISLARAYLAAYRVTRARRQRDRAAALLSRCERDLLDEKSLALFDRPATGELSPRLDRVLAPRLEYRAWRAYVELAAALAPGDPFRARVRGRADALKSWLWDRRRGLDPAALAVLASAEL